MTKEIRHTIGGVEIVITMNDDSIEFWAPSLGSSEPLGFLDAFYITEFPEREDIGGNICMFILDPRGVADGPVAIAVYKPDGVVVGAADGGHADEADIYCKQQMAFVIEDNVYVDPKEW